MAHGVLYLYFGTCVVGFAEAACCWLAGWPRRRGGADFGGITARRCRWWGAASGHPQNSSTAKFA